jgi:hydroxymethylpyrimidine/phosphomethylpyrimidine kinase
MSEDPPKVVLTIAGFDPSSGAGITADLKTIAAHHLYGVACITALTVQSTEGVRRVQAVDAELVRETLEALIADICPAAVKIGMLGTGDVAEVVADFLSSSPLGNVVLDPVLRSSSGASLLDAGGFSTLRNRLLGRANVITPNLEEAGLVADMEVRDLDSAQAAARNLVEHGAKAVVVTGGHLKEATDVLAKRKADGSIEVQTFAGQKVETANTHGTGCAFSTALACNLALGLTPPKAVQAAKAYVTQALKSSYAVGKGVSPINHLFGE